MFIFSIKQHLSLPSWTLPLKVVLSDTAFTTRCGWNQIKQDPEKCLNDAINHALSQLMDKPIYFSRVATTQTYSILTSCLHSKSRPNIPSNRKYLNSHLQEQYNTINLLTGRYFGTYFLPIHGTLYALPTKTHLNPKQAAMQCFNVLEIPTIIILARPQDASKSLVR